jgi:hypothetical protein
MYKVTYYPSVDKKDVLLFKWFKTQRESLDFTKTIDTQCLFEIKFYDENDPNTPTVNI